MMGLNEKALHTLKWIFREPAPMSGPLAHHAEYIRVLHQKGLIYLSSKREWCVTRKGRMIAQNLEQVK